MQCKLFRTKCNYAFKGTCSAYTKEAKVGAILNWLRDNAYEIHSNFNWTAPTNKDDPDKVLDEFEKYFKPAHSKYHSWCTLGTIYSSQFKGQSEFMVKLDDVIRNSGFDHGVETEIVKFLFLTHYQNCHVMEELIKNMKDGDSLNTILGYAKYVEGTQHSEHLSKVYLDTIKIPNYNVKVKTISQKHKGSNKRQNSKHRSQSKGKPPKGSCHNCGTNHPLKKCPAHSKTYYSCNKKGHFKCKGIGW